MAIETRFEENTLLAALTNIQGVPPNWEAIVDASHTIISELGELQAYGAGSIHADNVERDALAAIAGVYLAQIIHDLDIVWDVPTHKKIFWEKTCEIARHLLRESEVERATRP
jgi:hypothetical protein